MAISVIVSNFNGAHFLPRLLKTLTHQKDVEIEIIVIDRNSDDDSRRVLSAWQNILVVQEPPETGMVSGYTAGAKKSRYEHLFFCNEDMWFDPDCLRHLEVKIDIDKRIGAADPWHYSYDGSVWIHGGVRFKRDLQAIDSPYPLVGFDFTVNLSSGEKVPLPCPGGFLIHRKVFEELGGWDTSFFMDREDIDLFIRAWQRDWLCITVPEAKVYHALGVSSRHKLKDNKEIVRKRRYISLRANTMIISVKYFSLFFMPFTFAAYLFILISHCLKLRLRLAGWDILALMQVLRRLDAALKFRLDNIEWNQKKPGQKFFTEPGFLIK